MSGKANGNYESKKASFPVLALLLVQVPPLEVLTKLLSLRIGSALRNRVRRRRNRGTRVNSENPIRDDAEIAHACDIEVQRRRASNKYGIDCSDASGRADGDKLVPTL